MIAPNINIDKSIHHGSLALNDAINWIDKQTKEKIVNVLKTKIGPIIEDHEFKTRLSKHIIDYIDNLKISETWMEKYTDKIVIHNNDLDALTKSELVGGTRSNQRKKKSRKNKTHKKRIRKVQKKRYVGGISGGSISDSTPSPVRLDGSQLNELTKSMRHFYNWILHQPEEMLETMATQVEFTKNTLTDNPAFIEHLQDTFTHAAQNVFINQLPFKYSDVLQKSIFDETFNTQTETKLNELLVGNHETKIERFRSVLNNTDNNLQSEQGVVSINQIYKNYSEEK